ncbi:hypothetical protein RJ639_020233 [Escallonia herrerae]|uniref:Uncharacterized protein n=1 Tax=Escallonia herrerae TaxID=1293975 RepID=A0AA89AJ03_9ASTE|nr:hypothetical protein RJ639_020233 [Escallonia herrerae]
MPPENLQNFMVDPRMIEMQNGAQIINPPAGARAPRDVANRNALAVLFESMLPWVDYGRREAGENGQHDDHVQGNILGVELPLDLFLEHVPSVYGA